MLSVTDAKIKIIEELKIVEYETISLDDALGRVLAKPLKASVDSPSFSNSSMDGFAVISANLSGASKEFPIELEIIGVVPAGAKPDQKISFGQTMKIMTGAMIPDGADSVIPVENSNLNFHESNTEEEKSVEIYKDNLPGDYIRLKGEDFKNGKVLLNSQTILRPQDLSIFAMMGINLVEVFSRVKIGIFSTGDELLAIEQQLEDGKIRETNSYSLKSQIFNSGAEVVDFGIVEDNETEIRSLMDQAINYGVNMIVSSAGVSAGEFDYVRKVVEENGELSFWKVNMRPGKPLAFGSYKGIPFFGLPGNPVSAFVGYEVFISHAIDFMGGKNINSGKRRKVALSEDVHSDGRESYLRAFIDFNSDNLKANLVEHQGSGNIFSLVKANSLIIIPAGIKHLEKGELVEYLEI
ncbi:MAG: molybdopterin molybdotransferase MoeA [Chloroflexi bacterium]|jgi:molybdopterin molybdotransferase|nr:molybdopterin molybdotransferase MoeA [Chloroflexota bacterium]MBT4002570.1 molybdopterin molybdotransferase MoeA [Chloroflexota bacterium]MBT4305900.1 molybdopterin molybdotransferase MoeA [Chloroflexota bacterium]MBT4533725.1 molybdopterin molybdotransferase MoeA [Chloroflexota bacterium]MBT4681632.1 molybdopterin molybdotransferase MoeA [Chloroflexota bacterium]